MEPRVVDLSGGRFMVIGSPKRELEPIIIPDPEPMTDDELESIYGITQPEDPLIRYVPLWNLSTRISPVPVMIIDSEDMGLVKTHSLWGTKLSKMIRVYTKTKAGHISQFCRVIMNVTHHKLPVHHRNEDPLDNRKSNLVVCTVKEHWEYHRILRAQKIKGVHLP